MAAIQLVVCGSFHSASFRRRLDVVAHVHDIVVLQSQLFLCGACDGLDYIITRAYVYTQEASRRSNTGE